MTYCMHFNMDFDIAIPLGKLYHSYRQNYQNNQFRRYCYLSIH